MRADPHPPTYGRRPLPLRGRGDTAAAAADELESLCRNASPAQDVRTEIWGIAGNPTHRLAEPPNQCQTNAVDSICFCYHNLVVPTDVVATEP